MSKIPIDEVAWSEQQHHLKKYAILMKAIHWRNATRLNLQKHSYHNIGENDRRYNPAHTINSRAQAFLDCLTHDPMFCYSCGNMAKSTKIEETYTQIVQELLA